MSFLLQKIKELKAFIQRLDNFATHTYEGKSTAEFLSEASIQSRKTLSHWIYNAVFALAIAFILVEPRTNNLPNIQFRVGDSWEEDINSPIAVEIELGENQNSNKESLTRRIPPIYNYDDSTIENWLSHWQTTFQTIRKEFYTSDHKRTKNPITIDVLSKRIFELTGQNMRLRDVFYLHDQKFNIAIEKTFVKIAQELLLDRIISTTDLFSSHYSTGIIVRQKNQSNHETLVQDVSRIWSLEQAREVLKHPQGNWKEGKSKEIMKVLEILGNVIVPNLVFDEVLTQKRVAAIIEKTKQPILNLKEGQVFIRKGERITEQQLETIYFLRNLTSRTSLLKRFLYTFIVIFFFISFLFRINFAGKGIWNLPLKDASFFLGTTLFTLATVKYLMPYVQFFFNQFGLGSATPYLFPISTGGIILVLLMGTEAAYIYAICISILIGYLLDQNVFLAIWGFTVSATAIQNIGTCKQRTDLFKFGALSGLVGAILVLAHCLIISMGLRRIDWTFISSTMFLSFLSGILSTIITSSMIPFLETVFGYTTNLKLLELSNFHHPILHNLMLKAPGTYHHSVIVGSLAEIAADKIHANPLLARVSAYYHDIGKMNKPLYFIENQSQNNNPHDHLQPSMSAKILFSHVKNGVKMGREHGLGSKIIDIIEQHHGTTLASYFYNKAKNMENPELETVEESHFRYPGPKPQTREAGIVMLADACEAATRSIAEPTPAKIQTMVHNIITKRFLEEQFSDCDLTLSDLKTIEENFTRTLVSLYHHRIEYPGQKAALNSVTRFPSPDVSIKKSGT